MSNRYKGGVISATPPTLVAGAGASGTWTLEQQMQATAAGLWPVNGPFYIEDVFSTWLYTGTGANQTITNGINLSGSGGLVWTKSRAGTSTFSHRLVDTVRGSNNGLRSNGTFANQVLTNAVTGFTSTGYTLGPDSTEGNVNYSSAITYVSWTFRKQPKFFDVVTFSGTGSAQDIAHNLGSTPGCIIVKNLDALTSWAVYHRSLGGTYITRLNTDGVSETGYENWANTDPTSTVFTVGNGNATNGSGYNYVAYVFAHNAGGFGLTGTDNVISCGTYTGNGAANGQLINLGYEAQWVMIKNSSSDGDWWMLDTMRGWFVNGDFGSDQALFANQSSAESGQVAGQPDAQGFRPIQDNINASGNTYIYIAIRRGPMRTPTTGTSVFSVETYNQTSTSDPAFNLGKVADMGFRRLNNFESNWTLQSRLTENGGLITNTTAAESTQNYGFWDNNVGWYQGAAITPPYSQANWYGWTFARAPGFFDEVCYTGTGSATTQTHNLGVVPELMILKPRSNGSNGWCVYSATVGNTGRLLLDTSDAAITGYSVFWNSTTPTSTVFSLGTAALTNESATTFVAYLFASCPGVSKVGSYTGTGTTLQVDCGFTGGSRFVLIKRTDSTGDWYVWDSARGIVAGNDPYLLLNSTAVEVTNTDYVDTYSAGFEITSTAPAGINANGGTYIFLAIA